MKILYQSQLTGKTYETQEALNEAEKAFSDAQRAVEEKKQARAAAAKEVEAKLKLVNEAQEEAQKAVAEFCKKYGTFKTTLNQNNSWLFNPWDFLKAFF